jgi:hypothetical protein
VQARNWKTKNQAMLALLAVSFVFVSLILAPVATACPLFVNENADYLTNLQVTPLNTQLDYLTDENHKAMPVFSVASNETAMRITGMMLLQNYKSMLMITRQGAEGIRRNSPYRRVISTPQKV